jgi:hypothetical protein
MVNGFTNASYQFFDGLITWGVVRMIASRFQGRHQKWQALG